MIDGIFNVIYEAITGKSRMVYYALWRDGVEYGRWLKKHQAIKAARQNDITGMLIKNVVTSYFDKTDQFHVDKHHEYAGYYVRGVRN